MSTATKAPTKFPRLRSCDIELDTSPGRLGELRRSDDAVGDATELRRRMDEDGYLFLPGYLDRDEVFAARAEIVRRLEEAGQLVPSTPPTDAIANPESKLKFAPELAKDNAPLFDLLYTGPMISFYETLLGGPILHFDFTWLRAISPGRGTAPHGDSVFMNRGSSHLYTSWVPLGDIDFALGGLTVLGRSHRLQELRESYLNKDVDLYCENDPDAELFRTGQKWFWNGVLSDDPAELQRQLGLPWLTTEYRAGDLLVFTFHTLHCSLDNQTDRFRLSSDSRYQLASEPADHRWIGADPVGHGPGGRRGRIC